MQSIVYAGCAVSFGCAAWVGFAAVRYRGDGWLLLLMMPLSVVVSAIAITIILDHVSPRPADIPTMVVNIVSAACLAAFGFGALVASLMNVGAGNNKTA